jgi:hypothetical protein
LPTVLKVSSLEQSVNNRTWAAKRIEKAEALDSGIDWVFSWRQA